MNEERIKEVFSDEEFVKEFFSKETPEEAQDNERFSGNQSARQA